jgi:hypothetical protein
MPASGSEAHFALTMEWRLSHKKKRLFDKPISNGRYPPNCDVHGRAPQCPANVCAVPRRRLPVGASPTRRTLQPEATGAVMDAASRLNGTSLSNHNSSPGPSKAMPFLAVGTSDSVDSDICTISGFLRQDPRDPAVTVRRVDGRIEQDTCLPASPRNGKGPLEADQRARRTSRES